MHRIILIFILLLIVLILPIIPDFIMKNVVEAYYVKPKEQIISNEIYCHGHVTSVNQSELYTDTPILPLKINCHLGEKVKKGDLLAEIDSDKTVNILSGSTPIEKSLEKVQKILDAIPNKEIIYRLGKAYGIDKKQIDEILNLVKYSKIENNVLYIPKKITAPFDGTIIEINLSENVLSNQSKPAFKISSCDDKKILADVPQKYADMIYLGMQADINYGSNDYAKGVVSFIYPIAENDIYNDNIVKVEIEPIKPNKLKPGYDVKISFKVKDEKGITIPVEAINQDEETQYVYVYKNDKIEKRLIETGNETPTYSEVTKGLSKNDIILITEKKIKPEVNVVIKGKKEENKYEE